MTGPPCVPIRRKDIIIGVVGGLVITAAVVSAVTLWVWSLPI